jgi:hypothetical protein
MTEHLGDIKAFAKPSSDQGLTFEDDSDTDSDSGLEELMQSDETDT